jgi:hypothetical protein
VCTGNLNDARELLKSLFGSDKCRYWSRSDVRFTPNGVDLAGAKRGKPAASKIGDMPPSTQIPPDGNTGNVRGLATDAARPTTTQVTNKAWRHASAATVGKAAKMTLDQALQLAAQKLDQAFVERVESNYAAMVEYGLSDSEIADFQKMEADTYPAVRNDALAKLREGLQLQCLQRGADAFQQRWNSKA